MNIQDINIPVCMDILKPHAAEFSRDAVTLTPRLGTEEVRVEWGPFSTTRQLPMLKEFLRFFTWPTNAENADVALSYVDAMEPGQPSFTVKGQEFFGRWRGAFVTERKEQTGVGVYSYFVGIVLRAGWAETLADDEWRVREATGTPATGDYKVTRYCPNISNTLLESLTRTLKATTSVTAPQMEEKTLTGITFAASGVRAERNDDGSGTVLQTLTQVSTPTNIATLAACKNLKTREKSILDLFNFQTGTGDKIVFVFSGLNPNTATETVCMTTLSDSDLVTQFASGYTFAGRTWKVQEDGTATFMVAFQKDTWVTWSDAAADHTDVARTGTGQNFAAKSRTWENIRIADLAAATAALIEGGAVGAESGYHVAGVSVRNHRDGRFDITQQEIAKTSIVTAAGGSTLANTSKIDPFALQSGTLGEYRALYENFTAAELTALVITAPTNYTLIESPVTPNKQTGFFDKLYVYQLTTWLAWGHDSYAADIIEYDNAGTANERENITLTWVGIRKADIATVESSCRTFANIPAIGSGAHAVGDIGTNGGVIYVCKTAYTGEYTGNEAKWDSYVLLLVRITDRQNGSLMVRQVIGKQVNGKTSTAVVRQNPHGWQFGDVTQTITYYDRFTAATLPDGTAVGTSNVVSNVKSPPDGDGLYARTVIAEQTTWSNTITTGNPASSYIVGKGPQAAVATDCEQTTRIPGLAKDQVASGLVTVNATAGDGSTYEWLIQGLRLAEKDHGEYEILLNEKKAYLGTDDADAVIVKIVNNVGNRDKAILRVWYRRTAAAMTTLTTATTGKAVIDYTWGAVLYTHTDVTTDDHRDGSYTVTQLLTVPGPLTILNRRNRNDKAAGEDAVTWRKYLKTVIVDADGLTAIKTITEYRKVFANAADAWTYANVFPDGAVPPATPTVFHIYDSAGHEITTWGHVEYLGGDNWAGYRITGA